VHTGSYTKTPCVVQYNNRRADGKVDSITQKHTQTKVSFFVGSVEIMSLLNRRITASDNVLTYFSELNAVKSGIAAVTLNEMIKKMTCSTRGTRNRQTSTLKLLTDPVLRPAAEFDFPVVYMGGGLPTGTAVRGEAAATVSTCALYSSGRSSKYSVPHAD